MKPLYSILSKKHFRFFKVACIIRQSKVAKKVTIDQKINPRYFTCKGVVTRNNYTTRSKKIKVSIPKLICLTFLLLRLLGRPSINSMLSTECEY